MAKISELLEQVEDKALRARLQEEFDRLSKTKKFGLVFEDHIPECTPLYGIGIKIGSNVAKKAGQIKEVYTVVSIDGTVAKCYHKPTKETTEIPLEELVPVAQFGEPIFPMLQPIDSIQNAPDSSLWHTLIEADNYHALQLLEYLYAGKVDCIYIDPPYNLGGDFVYNDNYVSKDDQYRHSKWLSFMQKRLLIARQLLSPEGIILISINDTEYAHLKMLCDDIFFDNCYQATLIWKNRQRADSRNKNMISTDHEYILVYGRTANVSFVGEEKDISKYSNPDNDPRGPWASIDLSGLADATRRPNLHYNIVNPSTGITYPPNPNRGWSKSRETVARMIEENRILWPSSSTGRPREKKFLRDLLSERTGFSSVLDCDAVGYTTDGTKALNSIFEGKAFNFPKSIKLIKTLIAQIPKKDCLVIDFFAGSGTTLHAVNLLNAEDGGRRRCIMVTNNEVSLETARSLTGKGYQPGDPEWEKQGVARYVTWPRTVCSIKGQDMKGNPLKGNYQTTSRSFAMSDGFAANAEYFKLGFLDRDRVSLGQQFKEILPLLWLKAGAVGKRPEADEAEPDMLILPENGLAVLVDETMYASFLQQVKQHHEIKMIFFVTDSEEAFREMSAGVTGYETFQLYRDYIDNFVLGGRRA
ncbi:MAG: site-specific DNA-methyltransferase [Clostridia bacterium]|nr:site-specific DNA-methyltransferase [Clostridia bacterium]